MARSRPLRLRPALPLLGVLAATVGATSSPSATAATRGADASDVEAGWLEHRWARSDLEALTAALRRLEAERGRLPVGDPTRELEPRYLAPAPRLDPWGTRYRFDLTAEPPVVVSAGPDRRFASEDDVVADVRAETVTALADAPSRAGRAEPTAAPATLDERQDLAWQDLAVLARALEAFRAQRGHYPPGADLAAVEVALVPEHLAPAQWSDEDPWGRPFRYRGNDVGSSYTLVTSGADGELETLVPLLPGAVGSAARDLVVVDGRFVRWPVGMSAEPSTAPARRATSRANRRPAASPGTPTDSGASRELRRAESDTVEPGRHATTRARLEAIATLLAAYRAEHDAYPESDDASRVVSEDLGADVPAEDAWGTGLAYLTRAGGSRYALASAGPDRRFDRFIGEYADGAAPAGDDLLVRNGTLVR